MLKICVILKMNCSVRPLDQVKSHTLGKYDFQLIEAI